MSHGLAGPLRQCGGTVTAKSELVCRQAALQRSPHCSGLSWYAGRQLSSSLTSDPERPGLTVVRVSLSLRHWPGMSLNRVQHTVLQVSLGESLHDGVPVPARLPVDLPSSS